MQALTRIVHTYAPAEASVFWPDHWLGLQPDPYTLRRVSDAMADHECLDPELTAIRIAGEAIAVSPELSLAKRITHGRGRREADWAAAGVSWIMSTAPPAPRPAVYNTAYRLLTQAGAADRHLRRLGQQNLTGPPHQRI